MSFSPGDRCGPYEIVNQLGQGGMGEVFRARDARLGRAVAIKILPAGFDGDRDRLSRFAQEARVTGALNHPNVLSVYDVGETDSGIQYIVTELLEGETLRQRLDTGPIPRTKALEYGLQIARGLAAAHQQGIIHRDLKPENLFITRDGRMKILDFGLAKLSDVPPDPNAETQRLLHTTPGLIVGTAGYMSPEQVRGTPADCRSDVFSFGVVLLEMITGRRAFQAGSLVETLNAILHSDPTGLGDGLPPPIERLIRRCLEKNPDERIQTAQDLAFAVESLADFSNVIAPPAAPRRRRKGPLVAVATLLLLAALGAVFGSRRLFMRAPAVAPRPPAFRQLTFRLGNITAARFAPDGRSVLYSAAWEGKPLDVFTTRRSAAESRALGLSGTGLLSISSKEEIALSAHCAVTFGQCMDGTLSRISLAGGAPRELFENVAAADWAPDGSELAIVRPVEGTYRLEFPANKVLYTTSGWITSPRFSPDGKQIAFCDHPTLGDIGGAVVIVDLAGRRRVASSGWRSLTRLAWSPRGDEIWVSGSRDDGSEQIYGVTLEGSLRQVFTTPGVMEIFDVARNGDVLLSRTSPRARMLWKRLDTAGDEAEMSWFDWSTAADISADGKTILFREWGKGAQGVPSVYIRSADGSDAIRLGDGKALSLSPDGQWALTLNATSTQVVALPTRAGEKRVLPPGAIKTYYSAAWFGDGRQILFVGEESDGRPATFVQQLDGGPPRAVGPKGMRGALVAPDGSAFAGYGPDGEIYRVPLDGSPAAPIEGAQATDSLVQWSSDGRSLFVRDASYDTVAIFKLDLTSGARTPWHVITPHDRVGFIGFDSDGVKITPDGRICIYTYWRVLAELFLAEGLR